MFFLVHLRWFHQGAELVKAVIKSAFSTLLASPLGFNSLGFQFEETFYFGKCLPMGFSMSCFYFECFSTFIEWVVSKEASTFGILQYLDDFLFVI